MTASRNHKILLGIFAVVLVAAGLYLTSLYSYLLFHSLVEMATVAVGCSIFILAWNSRRYAHDPLLLFLGIAFLFIAVLDLFHALAYKGMNVFPGYGANLPTQLWIAARYLQALSLLVAPVFLTRRLSTAGALAAYGLLLALILIGVFSRRFFPDCYVEGVGLTPFKIISEYVICLILLAAIALYLKMKNRFHPSVLRLLIISLSLTIAAELAFTFYVGVYDHANLLGHFFKLAAYYTIYRAIISFSLNQPFEVLYRDLRQRDEDFLESQKRVKAIYQNMPFPVFIWQAEKGEIRLVDFNLAAQKVIPQRLINFLGKSAREIHEQSHPDIVRDLEQCLRKRKVIRREMDYTLSATGEKMRLIFTYAFIPPNLLMMHSENITERKKSEEALKKSEARYNALFTNNPVPCYLWQWADWDFKLVHFNKSAETFTRGKIGLYKGWLARDYFVERPDLVDDMERCFKERFVVHREEEFVSRSSGRTTYGVRTLAFIEPNLVLSIFEDRTELKQKEEALRQSQERLKALFIEGPLPTFIWRAENGDFVLTDVNQAAEKRSDGKIRQYLGMEASQVYKGFPAMVEGLRECLRKKAVIQLETPYQGITTGRRFDARMTFGFVAPDIVILHVEDISERKESEKALKESEARYNSLFHYNPIPSLIWQYIAGDFKLLHINKCAEDRTLGKLKFFLGCLASEFYADRPDLLDDMKRCHESREVVVKESEFVTRATHEKIFAVQTLAPVGHDLVLLLFDDRTDLKKKEEALKQSEERLKSLFKQGPMVTLIWRAEKGDFVLADFNQETERASKGNIQQYLGIRASEFYHEYPQIVQNIHKCLRDKAVVQEELKYHPRTVDIFHDARMTFGFVEPDMVIHHIEDISERKESEKALKESEARYNALFLYNPIPSFIWQHIDGDFKLIQCNKRADTYTGGKIRDFLGSMASDFYADRPDIQDDMKRCFTNREVVRRESDFLTRTDKKKVFSVHTYAPVGEDLILVVFDDRSELKQKEEALINSEERLKSLFNQGPMVTLIWQAEDGDFILADYNREAERSSGGKIQEFMGGRASDIYHDSPLVLESLRKCLAEKAIFNKEMEYHPRTKEAPYEARMTFGFVAPNMVIHYIEDISERKQAELEKENLIAELQKALAEVRALSGLLPICANCKKIRDDTGYWQQLEEYIQKHSEAQFTHGICPECAKKLYPELDIKK